MSRFQWLVILFSFFPMVGCTMAHDFRTLYEENLAREHTQSLSNQLTPDAQAAVEQLTHSQLHLLASASTQTGGDLKSMQTKVTDPKVQDTLTKLTPNDAKVVGQAAAQDTPAQQNDATTKTNGQLSFAGINFGAGVGAAIDLGGRPRVTDASVVNGVVRVNETSRVTPRVLLESHYFFIPDHKFLGETDAGNWGWGPFMGLQSSGNEVIDSIGFGLQLGFKAAEKGSSFNFGVGILVDPKAQVLGDGINAGQPLPAGETQVRFKKEAKESVLIEFSFTF